MVVVWPGCRLLLSILSCPSSCQSAFPKGSSLGEEPQRLRGDAHRLLARPGTLNKSCLTSQACFLVFAAE